MFDGTHPPKATPRGMVVVLMGHGVCFQLGEFVQKEGLTEGDQRKSSLNSDGSLQFLFCFVCKFRRHLFGLKFHEVPLEEKMSRIQCGQ